MATLGDPIAENLQLYEDPDTGRLEYVVRFPVYDLTPSDQPMDLIVQAVALMPARGVAGPIPGTYVIQRTPNPEPPCDCYIDVRYATPRFGDRVGDAPRITIGTSLDQAETDFDATNLAKPYAQRTPISVSYDKSSTGAPGGSADKQGASVPILLPRSVVTFTRRVSYNPGAESRQYTGKKNSDAFFGCEPGTLLILEIQGDSDDYAVTFRESIAMLYDPVNFHNQFARWVDPGTGRPPDLTNTQLAAQNGIKEIVVQGSIAYAGLHLTV